MKNNTTEIVFILDRSGSMSGFEDDTIGGFNSMISEQKEREGTVYVSTVLFNTFSSVLHDRVPISDVKPMTHSDYRVGGCTALLDALGDAIHHIGNIHKYARPEDVPEHTVFVITTDGMENSSHKYTSERIKKEIKLRQEEYGWEFIFLAANIDAVETAAEYGIRSDRAAGYRQDKRGMKITYETVSKAITSIRCCEDLDKGEWRQELDDDYKEENRS